MNRRISFGCRNLNDENVLVTATALQDGEPPKRIGELELKLEQWPTFYSLILLLASPAEISFSGDSMINAALAAKRKGLPQKKKYLMSYVHATPEGVPLAMSIVVNLNDEQYAHIDAMIEKADRDMTMDAGIEEVEVKDFGQAIEWIEEHGGL